MLDHAVERVVHDRARRRPQELVLGMEGNLISIIGVQRGVKDGC
jgi:hypothetical protein